MARSPRAIVPEEPKEASPWSAVVLMASSVGAFALVSLFLATNHRWTDLLLASMPSLTPAIRLSSDGVIAEQMRIVDVRTEHLTLSDRSSALLFEATVVNDAAMPVLGIVLEVEGFREGDLVATSSGTCGKNVSVRLLKRLSRDEVAALMQLATPDSEVLASGARTGCQVALTGLRTEIEEVSFRIAAVEPIADHLPSGRTSNPPAGG